MATVKRKGIIHIELELCKGCGICAHFCPTKALGMKDFKAYATNPDTCIACMMCELRCPDFAIEIKVEK